MAELGHQVVRFDGPALELRAQGRPALGHRPLGPQIRGREIHGQQPVTHELAVLHEPQRPTVRLQLVVQVVPERRAGRAEPVGDRASAGRGRSRFRAGSAPGSGCRWCSRSCRRRFTHRDPNWEDLRDPATAVPRATHPGAERRRSPDRRDPRRAVAGTHLRAPTGSTSPESSSGHTTARWGLPLARSGCTCASPTSSPTAGTSPEPPANPPN